MNMSDHFSDNWIPAKDKRPEDGQSCIVWKSQDMSIKVYNDEHNCWDDEYGDDYCCEYEDAEYWMPLPKAPGR